MEMTGWRTSARCQTRRGDFTSRDGILPNSRRFAPMADSAEFFSPVVLFIRESKPSDDRTETSFPFAAWGEEKKKRTNRKLSYHWHYHGASSRLNWRRRLPSDVLQYDVPRKRKAISRNGAGSRSGSRFVARDKKSTAAELTRAKIMPVFSLSRLISSLTRYGHQA